MNKKFLYLSGSLIGLPLSVWAATNAASTPTIAGSSAGSLLQVLFALALVLGLIVAAAWLMRRFSLVPGGGNAQLRVVSAVMVGSRERVVIVEVQGQWLVLGVTHEQVNLLHTLEKPADAVTPTSATPAFAQWLQTAIEKRQAKNVTGAKS